MIADWTHYPQLRPPHWEPSDSVLQWWLMLGTRTGVPRSGLRSLILLVVWEIWKERNARTFHRKEQSATNLLLKIKEEARAWGMAGAKRLASFLSGAWERLLYFCIIYFFFDLFSLRWERLLINSFTNRNGAQSCRRSFKKKRSNKHAAFHFGL